MTVIKGVPRKIATDRGTEERSYSRILNILQKESPGWFGWILQHWIRKICCQLKNRQIFVSIPAFLCWMLDKLFQRTCFKGLFNIWNFFYNSKGTRENERLLNQSWYLKITLTFQWRYVCWSTRHIHYFLTKFLATIPLSLTMMTCAFNERKVLFRWGEYLLGFF